MKAFPDRNPGDGFVYRYSFANMLALTPGATITTVTGVTSEDATLTISGVGHDATGVNFTISGGTNRLTSIIDIKVVDSNGIPIERQVSIYTSNDVD